MIDNSIVDKIIEVAQCYEVIKDFVTLKKAGANWVGLSPFTDEKTPSFTVSPIKNIWKDYSSGNGGHAVTYLMKARGMNFPDAIKYLGKKYNIEIQENKKFNSYDLRKQKDKKAQYSALDFSKKHFTSNLLTKNDKALQYLKNRGFTSDTMVKFELGYSLDSWTDLLDHSVENKHAQEDLLEVDLLSQKGRRHFDKFRDRLMFPIVDVQGKTIGYGARILTDDKTQAKYLNSSETALYKKSYVLYGINLAIQEIIREDMCYVVEGYTDVISFHQSGVCNTVASCGTALTIEQLKVIKRYTQNVAFIFDGDRAGTKATYKSIDLALEAGLNVSVLKLKDVDPDELAKSTKDLKQHIVKNLMDFVDYKVTFIDHTKIDAKAKYINNIITSVTLIEDSVKRKLYSNKVTEIFNLDKKDFTKIVQAQKKAFKPSLRKKHVFVSKYISLLNDVCENNPKHSIDGICLLNYVILKIQELEDPILEDFVIDYSDEKDLILNESTELVLKEEISSIFNKIKLEFMNSKLSNIQDENLNFIQDLIYIKQNV
jgi:DNA primase